MSIILEPAESIALTVGRAQVERGEEPMPNIAAVCIMALARLVDEEENDATSE
jgi:hypothetical protein